MTDMGSQLLEQCVAEAENQRLAHEAEQEWRRYLSEHMRLDQEAFITFASRIHELMAEWTEVLRRLTELRIQRQVRFRRSLSHEVAGPSTRLLLVTGRPGEPWAQSPPPKRARSTPPPTRGCGRGKAGCQGSRPKGKGDGTTL
uniref:Uncharacterized protein n=1 Tax=Sphaerodactylus townsendi TaxID=933632 RepID=A0ACB8ESU4_9SAUR